MPDLTTLIQDNKPALAIVAGASLVMFLATLAAGPWLLLRLPPDYYTHDRRPRHARSAHPAITTAWLIARNIIAVVLLVAGVLMLVLPGQGLLTILVGFLLLRFPGKYRLEKRIIARPHVLRAINRLRTRRGRKPLSDPNAADA